MKSLKDLKNKKVTVYTVVDASTEDSSGKLVFDGYFEKVAGDFVYLKMSADQDSPLIGAVNIAYIMAIKVEEGFAEDVNGYSEIN